MPDPISRVRPCGCIICGECHGAGRVRDSDDDMESCERCQGSGIVEVCRECEREVEEDK